jgi:hypothetical protein
LKNERFEVLFGFFSRYVGCPSGSVEIQRYRLARLSVEKLAVDSIRDTVGVGIRDTEGNGKFAPRNTPSEIIRKIQSTGCAHQVGPGRFI